MNAPSEVAAPHSPAALQIAGLHFAYRTTAGSAPWSLHVAQLSLDPGRQLLLTGPSGRGKSTLLHLIAGLMDPDQGSVSVAGTNIHALRGASRDRFRGRHIGMIFQTFNLLPGFTALENVLVALMFSDIPPRTHVARASEFLRHLGIDKLNHTPDQLSVGQQQRVAVARALVAAPTLVLADEPTASLDPENAVNALRLICDVCRERGAALLCTSHDPSLRDLFPDSVDVRDLASTPAAAATGGL